MSKKLRYYGSTASFQNLYSNNMDGTSKYVLVGDHAQFSFGTNPFTFVVAHNRTAITGNRCIFSKFQGAALEYYAASIGTVLRFLCFSSPGNFIGRTAPFNVTGWIWLAFVNTGGATGNGDCKIYTMTTAGVVTQIDNADLGAGLYTGMPNTIMPVRFGALDSPQIWHFLGKQYNQQFYSAALTTAQLQEIALNPYKDARTYSFGANCVSAYHYPNGQADFPIQTDYVGGRNGTMTNAVNTDINTDRP